VHRAHQWRSGPHHQACTAGTFMAYRGMRHVAEISKRRGVGGRVPWHPGRDPQTNTNRMAQDDTVISSPTREVVLGLERPSS